MFFPLVKWHCTCSDKYQRHKAKEGSLYCAVSTCLLHENYIPPLMAKCSLEFTTALHYTVKKTKQQQLRVDLTPAWVYLVVKMGYCYQWLFFIRDSLISERIVLFSKVSFPKLWLAISPHWFICLWCRSSQAFMGHNGPIKCLGIEEEECIFLRICWEQGRTLFIHRAYKNCEIIHIWFSDEIPAGFWGGLAYLDKL